MRDNKYTLSYINDLAKCKFYDIKHNKSFYKDNKEKTREIYIQEGILKKQSILDPKEQNKFL